MDKNLKGRVLLILAVIAACVYFTFPLQKRINLGLDLKGGMHLILKVETEKLPENARNDAVLRAIEILRNRIDGMGVGETVIQRQGNDQLIVQLPGVTDRDAALSIIGQVAQLEFKMVESDPQLVKDALADNIPSGHTLKYVKNDSGNPVLLKNPVVLSGERISDARVDFDPQGFNQPFISLSFDSRGTNEFAKITREHTGESLAIILDGEVLSAPRINEPILGGKAQITGDFTFDEASLLALALRSGALPAPMRIEEERTIGPLLGKDSIEAGITATVLGGILVLAFMLIYYLLAGFVADIALLVSMLLIFGSMGLLNFLLPNAQVTLTLPGIAGIILTLGMAVDANVLINERIREEIANGRPLRAAVSSGFHKAFKAIFDSNITTLIAAFILFQFGSGPIKGFAVTLTIGLLSSLFTALMVTRTLLELIVSFRITKSLPMLQFFGGTNINFVAKRYIAIAISVVVIGVGLFAFISKQDQVYGIDFAGGQVQEYRFERAVEADVLRQALKETGVGNAVIQQFAQNPQDVIIRTPEDTYDQVVSTFKEKMPDNSFEILRIEKVGPIVGQALRRRAVLAMVFALAGILVYVGFRFKHFDFATAGIIALLHDVIISMGILVLMGRQIDLLVVTGLLTIAGYSINDTIIIYDRVRENLSKNRKASLTDILNLSINQTLGRTILTTLTTLFVVTTLFLKGGEVLNTFALCLLIGFIAGTYSTVFIAAPVVLALQKKPR
jgi:SecD/SecF fusion protein